MSLIKLSNKQEAEYLDDITEKLRKRKALEQKHTLYGTVIGAGVGGALGGLGVGKKTGLAGIAMGGGLGYINGRISGALESNREIPLHLQKPDPYKNQHKKDKE